MKLFKFNNWEYWPSYMFYIPNLPYAIYLAIRAKNIVFFSATNPAIKHSGNGSESKFSTIKLIPKEYRPVSIFIKKNSTVNKTLSQIKNTSIKYPLIIKPDIGFRGLLVKKINNENELVKYLTTNNFINLIIQEFITFENECGIFYHKIPGHNTGKITSITLKKYLSITGDGVSNLLTLINANDRAKKYLTIITELHQKEFNTIPLKGEIKVLSIIGNHAKGTQFINGNHLINKDLEKSIDLIFKKLPHWFYGRLDIKYNSFNDLKRLENFKILEINGIISEPTHIYDPTKTNYFNALKEIRKHWKIMYIIASTNHITYKIPYDSFRDFWSSLLDLKKYSSQLKKKSLI